jgi:hypothetical protein
MKSTMGNIEQNFAKIDKEIEVELREIKKLEEINTNSRRTFPRTKTSAPSYQQTWAPSRRPRRKTRRS